MATHRRCGKIATVTAVRPPSRYGGLIFESGIVTDFVEKPQIGEGWINGGFMMFEPAVFDHMDDHTDSLEKDVLERLAAGAAAGRPRAWRLLAVHGHAAGTGSARRAVAAWPRAVEAMGLATPAARTRCLSCDADGIREILSLGWLPLPNAYPPAEAPDR